MRDHPGHTGQRPHMKELDMKIQVKQRQRSVDLAASPCAVKQAPVHNSFQYQRLRATFFSAMIAIIVLLLAFSAAMATLVVLTRLSDRFMATAMPTISSDKRNDNTENALRIGML
jgi:hypothetical protein